MRALRSCRLLLGECRLFLLLSLSCVSLLPFVLLPAAIPAAVPVPAVPCAVLPSRPSSKRMRAPNSGSPTSTCQRPRTDRKHSCANCASKGLCSTPKTHSHTHDSNVLRSASLQISPLGGPGNQRKLKRLPLLRFHLLKRGDSRQNLVFQALLLALSRSSVFRPST